jgi:hypothetical protein
MKYLALLLVLPFVVSAGQNTKTGNTGRFQLIQLSDARRDQYLLDTETGRVWQRTCVRGLNGADCGLPAWRYDLVEGINVTTEKLDKAGE